MSETPLSDKQKAAEIYQAFALEILKRVAATRESLAEWQSNFSHPDVWKNADFSYLQVRKICGYLASLIAITHSLFGFHVKLSKWRPQDLLAECFRLSAHATPIPLDTVVSYNDGNKHLVPIGKPIRMQEVSRIYGQCSDMLHCPSGDRLLKQQIAPINFNKVAYWIERFGALYAFHCILLPGISDIMVCQLIEGQPIVMLVATGDGAVFNAESSPDFGLAGS